MKFILFRPWTALLLVTFIFTVQAMGGTTVRLLAFSRVGTAHEVLLAGADGKPLGDDPLELPTQQLSKARDVTSPSLLFFDAAAKVEGAPPKAQGALLGKVDLPDGEKELILIFLPNKQGAEHPYRVHAIAMPSIQFDSGAQAFINYCNRDILFMIDKQRVDVPIGKVGIYRPSQKNTNQVIAGYEKDENGKWQQPPFYSSRIIVQEGVRNLILIVRNPQTERPEFRGIMDILER